MEEEISLREIIEAIWNGKWIIAIITIIAVVASGIISFFVINPTYEARTTLMVNVASAKPQSTDINGVEELMNVMSQYPNLSIATYTEQVKNRVILKKVIDHLGLEEKGYTISSLANAIRVETIKDTNLIRIYVNNTDPKLASEIANTLSQEFVRFITEKNQEQIMKSAEYIKVQLIEEQKNLDVAIEELKAFMKQSPGVDELSQEITSRLEYLTTYKMDLSKIEVEITSNEAAIAQAKLELSSTPEKLITNKTLTEDAFLQSVVNQQTGQPPAETGKMQYTNEEINPIYTSLKSKISDLTIRNSELKQRGLILEEKLKEDKQRLEDLQILYTEKQTESDRLNRKVNTIRNTFNLFSQKYEEARITGSAKVGEANIMLMTPSVEPDYPIAPNKLLNVAIAGVLGLMVSVGIVFFISYWKSSDPRIRRDNNLPNGTMSY